MTRRLFLCLAFALPLAAQSDKDALATAFASRLRAMPEVSQVVGRGRGVWKKSIRQDVSDAYVFRVNVKDRKNLDRKKFMAAVAAIADELQLSRHGFRYVLSLNLRSGQ